MRHEPRPQSAIDLLNGQVVPPHAPEAERTLLGKLIIYADAEFDAAAQVLDGADDFYLAEHASIFQAVSDLFNRDGVVPFDGLVQRLRDTDQLEQVGGIPYLVELAESVPHGVGVGYYAKMVKQKAILRALIQANEESLVEAFTSADLAEDVLSNAEARLWKVQESANHATVDRKTLVGDAVSELYEDMANPDEASEPGLTTGFYDLDALTGGLHPGQLIICAARPSMGKSALAANIGQHVAIHHQAPVGIFSVEMTKKELTRRLLSSTAKIDAERINQRNLAAWEWEEINRATATLADAPLHIIYRPALSFLQLRSEARRMVQRYGLKLLIVDYLQLLSHGDTKRFSRAGNREQEVSEISRGLKQIAGELNVPVVCVAQLNRGPEARENHRPRMSDLRESGAVEQDADGVWLIYRADYYRKPGDAMDGMADVIVCKTRGGSTGDVRLVWDGPQTTFRNAAPDEDMDPALLYGEDVDQ